MRLLKWIGVVAALSMSVFATTAIAKTDITIGTQQEPPILDPTLDATASIKSMLAHNVYQCLTTLNEQGEIEPELATSWTISDDGLSYTFKLAKGVTFQDGTKFDAKDVKFSFDRMMNNGAKTKDTFKLVQAVTIIDPYTVEIKLKNKDAFFLFNIAQGNSSIFDPESADTNKTHPIGTGPFMFDSWKRGDRLVLKKYDKYKHAADVQMTKITYRFITDPAAAASALMAGELDAFPGFPAPELLAQFKADPRFKVTVGNTVGEVILAMNNSRKPFSDIRVRQAISHAINRKEIIDGAMYGMARPIGTFFPPSDKNYVDLTGLYPYDIAKAKALLKEAGVKQGTELNLRVPPFPYAIRTATIIQSQLAKIGLKVKIENIEWSAWIGQVYKKRDYDMTIIAHTSPNDLSNFARGKDYYYGYDNPKYDALWNKIKTESDPEKRGELLKDAQRFVSKQAVVGYLFELPQLGVYKKQLSGYWTSAPAVEFPLAGIKWTH